MELLDSRRLTGPNLWLPRAGAILELRLEAGEEGAVELWRRELVRFLAELGWSDQEITIRPFRGGAQCAFTAPFDALYAATEVAEAAWARVTAPLLGAEPIDFAIELERLRAEIALESRPDLRTLRAEAERRGVSFFADDEWISVGSGSGSLAWAADTLPDLGSIDWSNVHDIPLALVTGTNGKTTTVRLLAAMVEAAGKTAGLTSTEGISVGGEIAALGDFSGPQGARALLRDHRVDLAILEVARGGLLRRGLAVERAEVAVVTNVAEDHLGEYGIFDLDDLADAKLSVARALVHGADRRGRLVVPANDPHLTHRAAQLAQLHALPLAHFGLEPSTIEPGFGAFLSGRDNGVLTLALGGGERAEVLTVAEVPIAFGGAARHNVANALAAMAAAQALGLPIQAIAQGLKTFGGSAKSNRGRAELIELQGHFGTSLEPAETSHHSLKGVRALVDYAHNPHGLAALFSLAAAIPAERRLLVLGQAGDRDDEAIRELARTAWRFHPDHFVVKEMIGMLRGRELGEIPALLARTLLELGAPADAIEIADGEVDAVRRALRWAQPGDLLILLLHTEREAALALLDEVRKS